MQADTQGDIYQRAAGKEFVSDKALAVGSSLQEYRRLAQYKPERASE